MPRDLFGHVTRPSISVGSRKWYALPLSLISHSAIVALLIAIPILAPAVMPSVFADNDSVFIKIDVPKPPPLPAREMIRTEPVPTGPTIPTEAPTGISEEKPQPEPFETEGVSIVTGSVGPGGSEILAPPPEPVKPSQPVRPGFQGVRTPVKTHHVDPVYPKFAIDSRTQGIVIIEATIAEDGRVINARVLRSVPLLDNAALEAVRQWQFTPTMLNGVAVPVIMTVTVNFTLNR